MTNWKVFPENNMYEFNEKGEMRNRNTGRQLKVRKVGGYAGYRLYKNGKPFDYRIHRFMLTGFAPCDNMANLVVNHLDGNPYNSTIENLEWTTVAGNSQHAVRLGLIPSGEKHPNAKITELEAKEIIRLQGLGLSRKEIMATNPKFTRAIVGKIMNNSKWVHLERATTIESTQD